MSSSDQDQNSQKDVNKLQSIWKNMQQSKKQRISEKKSLMSVRDAIHLEEQKNLEARLLMTENQLTKAKENTSLLMKKLSEAEQEAQQLRQQLDNQRKDNQEKQEQIAALTSHLNSEEKQSKNYAIERQREALSDEIDQLKAEINNKNREIERLNLKLRSLDLDNQKQSNEMEKIIDQNQLIQKQLKQAQNTIHEIYLDQESKGAQLLQIDEKNRTIERLLNLLKSTAQFKQFALFTEDCKGVHFLKFIPKKFKNDNVVQIVPRKAKVCSCMDLKIEEKLIWTPAQSYKYMLDMKMKFDNLNEQCIEEVLFGLNQIWLARQESHIKRVRQSYQNQILKLKKKAEERFDQMLARKQIQRLKKQVHKTKYKAKGTNSLEGLKVVGQYEDELRLKEKQIKLLHQRVKLIQNESVGYDKVIYMEGALWVLGKVIEELQNNRELLKEFEEHFVETLSSIISTDQIKSQKLMKTYKYFFESLEQLNQSLYQKILLMQQSTTKKLNQKKIKEKQNNTDARNNKPTTVSRRQ